MTFPPNPSPIPAHWQYDEVGGVSTATYNGNVIVDGTINTGVISISPGATDADIADAIALAANSPGKILQIVGGTYSNLLSQIDFSALDGIEILGNAVFDFTNATLVNNFPSQAFVNIAGSALTPLPALAQDIAEGSETLVFSSDPGLKKNDIIVTFNPTHSSYSGFRAYYYAGEYAEISDTSSSPTIYRFGGSYAAYTAASVNLYKHAAKQFQISGPGTIRILESTAPALSSIAGVQAQFCAHIDLHAFQPTNSGYCGIVYDRCYDMYGVGYKVNQNIFGGSGTYYGLAISNSQKWNLTGDFYGGRHAVTTGGGDVTGAVPNREGYCAGTFSNSPLSDQGVCCVGPHGNTEYYTFEGVFNGGAIVGGNHSKFVGTFRGHSSQKGTVIYAGEWSGCSHKIAGLIETQDAPFADTGGAVVSMSENSSNMSVYTIYGGKIDLSGLLFNCPHADLLISVRNQGYVGSEPVIVDISNITWPISDGANPIIAQVNSPAGNLFAQLNCEGIYNGPAAAWSVNVSKIKGWRENIVVPVSPLTTEKALSQSFIFSAPAPKAPTLTMSLFGGTAGGSPSYPYPLSSTQNGGSVGVATIAATTFASTAAGSVSVVASLDE